MNAHLLEFDSVHGRFPGKITAANGHLKADGHDIAVILRSEPREASLARPRRRHRHGMHRQVHRPRRRRQAPDGRRQARARVRAMPEAPT